MIDATLDEHEIRAAVGLEPTGDRVVEGLGTFDEIADRRLYWLRGEPPAAVRDGDQTLLEAGLLTRLRQHDRIVTIRNVELAAPGAFIVMDYLPAGSVGARMTPAGVGLLDAVRWTRTLSEAWRTPTIWG
jgi:hypothetical protein